MWDHSFWIILIWTPKLYRFDLGFKFDNARKISGSLIQTRVLEDLQKDGHTIGGHRCGVSLTLSNA